MPVELERIPNKKVKPPRPVTRRWLIFGAVLLVVAIGLTVLFWQGERAGPRFWFFALVLPVLAWGALFSIRRTGYKLESVGQDSTNRTIKSRHTSDKGRGQRFAWLAGDYLLNELENVQNPTQKAALDKKPILQPIIARQGNTPVRHSRFEENGNAVEVLAGYLNDVSGRINHLLELLPPAMKCYVAMDSGEGLPDLAQILLPKINRHLIRIRDLTGLNILDYWLDYHYDKPSALLVISAQLNDLPENDSGEAITLILVTNCRLKDSPLKSVRIHRPQINGNGDLSHGLKHAMLWAGLDKEVPIRGWVTGGMLASSDALSSATEIYALKLTAQRCVNIDTVVGYAGAAAPWQALILATRQCLAEGDAQIAITESSPECRQLCVVTPE